MKYCQKCGNESADDVNFCGSCGNKLGEPRSEVQASIPQPTFNQPPQANKQSDKKKGCIGCLAIIVFFIIIVAIFGSCSNKNSTPPAEPAVTQEKTEKDKEKAIADANKAVIDMLGTFYKKTDEVEKTEWYTQWQGSYPAETAVYWYVGLNSDDIINQRVKIVHFSSDIDWVFWDKIIFSTTEKKWDYDIGSFAGQSGGGKSTQIVMGGKYETVDLPIKKVIQGVEIVTNGSNPIIRLQGKEHHYDIKLSSKDIDNLKNAIAFSKNAEIIGNRIIRAK
ncbi:zinc-ribbon domain-containing protein [Propionispora hippei]|uniref:Uncharacterized protein n=1 Tax=Propionispora hippei DSM 15287 TaxID=1123003 RepID=A0A1M6P9T6_9FIRM|nr:zinc ribbon domain-containing protein [Propionispora hippei]SHK04684.1 hypothetical protein SAMN02745170_03993 [Propionispora hippei DSM 15287]